MVSELRFRYWGRGRGSLQGCSGRLYRADIKEEDLKEPAAVHMSTSSWSPKWISHATPSNREDNLLQEKKTGEKKKKRRNAALGLQMDGVHVELAIRLGFFYFFFFFP